MPKLLKCVHVVGNHIETFRSRCKDKISKVVSSIKQVKDFIEELVQYDTKNSYTSYSIIKNLFLSLKIPYPVSDLNVGHRFVRCRLHLKGEKFFNKIDEISYRKDIKNILDFGRANEPIQAIFYASDRQEISFIETSFIIRNNNPLPSETVTMGVWEVQQPIKTASTLSNDSIKGKNQVIEKLTAQFTSITEHHNKRDTAPHLLFLDFISKQYTRNTNGDFSKYKISSAFSNYIFFKKWLDPSDQHTKNIDAIVFPSTMDLTGINVAIHPRTIESGKLRLIAARKSIMKKINGLHYSQEDIEDSKAIDYINRDIIWEHK